MSFPAIFLHFPWGARGASTQRKKYQGKGREEAGRKQEEGRKNAGEKAGRRQGAGREDPKHPVCVQEDSFIQVGRHQKYQGEGREKAGRWQGDGREKTGRRQGDGREEAGEKAGRRQGDGRENAGR